MHASRSALTIIEFVFIIVIIGILGAISISKLAGTRDDAKLSAAVSNMSICISDVGAHYAATFQDYTAENHPSSCDKKNTMCYDIVYSVRGQDFNVTTDPTGTDENNDTHAYCADIENVGGHLAKSYDFAGSTIKR